MKLYSIDIGFQKDDQETKVKISDGQIYKPRLYDQKSESESLRVVPALWVVGKGISDQFICHSLVIVDFIKSRTYCIINCLFLETLGVDSCLLAHKMLKMENRLR